MGQILMEIQDSYQWSHHGPVININVMKMFN
jgi:hypothetical protein